MQIEKEDIKILFTEDELQDRVKEMAKKINFHYLDEEIYVICVLKGAVMFTVDLVKYLTVPVKMEFIRLSSYGSSVTSTGKVNAVDISLPDLNGKNVLVVEDIIDTGLTAKFLLDFINNNFRTKTTKFCSLLDKKCFRKTEIEPDYTGFEIDNKFVIGYGLDYDGRYRNLSYIGYVEV
ncbi:MAG: hypoxanthine phosphoribosyltransferase [Candidatus Gastranaerophilaceae bacterium]